MKARFSWAETIGESILEKSTKTLDELALSSESSESSVVVFNSGGNKDFPIYIEFTAPREHVINGLQGPDGTIHAVQRLESRDDVFFETTVGMRMAKMGMGLIPGRKLMNFYINGVEFFDGENPEILELRFIADNHPVGDLDWEEFKRKARELIDSKKYKKVHLVAARPTQNVYASVVPLTPWAFTELLPTTEFPDIDLEELKVSTNEITNRFYTISFNKDGSLSYYNKEQGTTYNRLHVFEDFGDRGDEYTFGRVEPEKADVKKAKRTITTSGPIVAEIRQEMEVEVFESIDESREKRTGKVRVPIESTFRFYRDSPRVEVTTRLTNRSKDHRLRICFDLPFKSGKTKTATHFGVVERDGVLEKIPDAEEMEKTNSTYPERPSGIQAQKRFIRVDDDEGVGSITVFNTGLPEVELVEGERIAMTLVRSIGWLSRADIPERPVHAGPGEETPGAQELDVEYEFQYGFAAHSKDEPLHFSSNIADAASERPLTLHLNSSNEFSRLLTPIIQIDDPSVRISSVRMRDSAILVTMYNLENQEVNTPIKFNESFTTMNEVKIDGSKKREVAVSGNSANLVFAPREIKMCVLK
jgi:hypothetical protein